MTSNRFDVCVDWAGETLQVGTLYAHDRSAAAIGRWRSIAVRAGIADAALKAYADAFDAP
jgi:hypothetical protein